MDTEELLDSLEIMRFMEIPLVGVSLPINQLDDVQKKATEIYPELVIYSKLDLSEKDMKSGKIQQHLSQKRRKYHIISVEASSAKVAANIAKDGRVDLIRIGKH